MHGQGNVVKCLLKMKAGSLLRVVLPGDAAPYTALELAKGRERMQHLLNGVSTWSCACTAPTRGAQGGGSSAAGASGYGIAADIGRRPTGLHKPECKEAAS